MKYMKLRTMTNRAVTLLRRTLVLLLPAFLVACGGGTTPVTDVTKTVGGLRALSPEFALRKAVNYSPYRTATTVGDASKSTDIANEVITDEMIIEDLTLLKKAGFGMIRLFNSDEKVALRTLRVISDRANNLDFKVYLGMWMAGYNDAENKAQMALGVALANSYPSIVLAVSVGNETLVNWSDHAMSPAVLASHLASVRSQIKQPVTTDDNWAYYAAADRSILDNIDFAAVHTYAMVDTHYNPTFWDWKQLGETDLSKRAAKMMAAAFEASKSDYNAARSYLDKKGLAAMPIVIGETGWKAQDSSGANWYKYLAHPVNQKMYFERLLAWANEGKVGAGPKAIFYFEAFDEQWKGTDDKWGLFNKNREARYVIQDQHVADSDFKYEAGTYTAASAIYFAPPTVNPAISQSKYTILADKRTSATEYRADDLYPDLQWAAFDGGVSGGTAYPTVSTGSAESDTGNHSIEIMPNPRDYGWGLLFFSTTAKTENLSQFTNGNLNFSIKTAYQQKIEIGISTDTELEGGVESFLQISNGQYGYCNLTATWCNVSIPIQDFVKANPKLDLRLVSNRFVIADRFSVTKNTLKTGLPVVNIDNIYWSK